MDNTENIFNTPEFKKYFSQLGKKGGKARWKDHEKQTPEEKRKKWNEYQKEYRKKKKESL